MDDQALLAAGLVDELVARDLTDAAASALGQGFELDEQMGLKKGKALPSNPFTLMSQLLNPQASKTKGPTVAVIHMRGPIVTGESSVGDGMFTSDSIGSRSILEAVTEAKDDPNVKAVVIRIDSPGGSARASELIWQSVRDLADTKPVIASVGSMAASGGYYIVSATKEIYAQDGSIVGSIGVVGGKLVMKDLFDTIGLKVHQRTRGANGEIFSATAPFTDTQRDMIRESMETIYAQFLDRVELGRGDQIASLDDVAQGRIFSGIQAVENGLVDQIGGLAMAQNRAATLAGLDAGDYKILDLPRPMDLGTYLSKAFGGASMQASVNSPAAALPQIAATLAPVKLLLGDAAYTALHRQAVGLWQLQHEPVLTLMPAVLIVK